MGTLDHTSNITENTLKQGENDSNYQVGILGHKLKVPDYARDYKNEYLFIRGIDKQFKYFLDNINKADQGVFQNKRVDIIYKNINRLEKAIKMGYVKDNSNLEIDEQDVPYSYLLLEQLGDFSDYYVDDYDYEFDDYGFDDDDYEIDIDSDFPGYKNLVECIKLFHSKFNLVIDKYKVIWADSDSDEYDSVSDSDSDSDEPRKNTVSDSNSDSDSD